MIVMQKVVNMIAW